MFELLQYRAWALSESYFNRMYPIVSDALMRGHNLIKKKTIQDYHSRMEALINNVDPDTDEVRVTYDPWTDKEIIPTVKVNGKTIALIPVIGPLTKYGDACSYGMQDHQRFINMALKDDAVHGIVLIMDTPGGTVDGTPEMGQLVRNASKPIGVFGDGMVASAGMWIASQADVIVGNKNNPTEFGSIGVLMVTEDWSNVIESGRAPKMTIHRAPGSEDKALVNPIEPMTEETLSSVKSELKAIRDEFVSTVKSGRGDKLNAAHPGLFSGQMFDAQTSKSAGLIDSVGTLSTALNKVAELVKQRNKENGSSGSAKPNADSQMKFPVLSKLFSGEAWGKVLSAFTDDQAPLEATEKAVAEKEAEVTRLTTEKEAAEKKASELEATVAEHKAQITTLEKEKTELTAKVTELEKKPTGTATTVIPGNQEEQQATDPKEARKSYRTSVDEEAERLNASLNPKSK